MSTHWENFYDRLSAHGKVHLARVEGKADDITEAGFTVLELSIFRCVKRCVGRPPKTWSRINIHTAESYKRSWETRRKNQRGNDAKED